MNIYVDQLLIVYKSPSYYIDITIDIDYSYLSHNVMNGLPFSTKPNETERNLTKLSDYYRQMCYKNVSNSNISEGPSGGSRAAAVADGCRKVV